MTKAQDDRLDTKLRKAAIWAARAAAMQANAALKTAKASEKAAYEYANAAREASGKSDLTVTKDGVPAEETEAEKAADLTLNCWRHIQEIMVGALVEVEAAHEAVFVAQGSRTFVDAAAASHTASDCANDVADSVLNIDVMDT